MAKKKGSRKTASRGARKAATPRRRTRKAASRPRTPMAAAFETGLENPKQVNLKPLKSILTAQIKQLEGYPPRPEVESALRLLRQTKTALSDACALTRIPMVIEL